MAVGSLLALLDDIATLLDDISVLSKVAAKKTVGVLGDDLAVNAEQVSGVSAARELPVVWAVLKGSLLNKLIIVPLVLLLSAIFPWLITPLLLIGGLYLCFEGAEKVLHALHQKNGGEKDHASIKALLANGKADLMAIEREKVKGAIRTDFILSLEIVVIALGTMTAEPFVTQAVALSVIAVGVTIAVYGAVAAIVKTDDLGFYLVREKPSVAWLGRFLLWFAPVLMKGLTWIGTLAMFLVGGGIMIHSAAHYLGSIVEAEHWIHLSPSMVMDLVNVGYNGVVGLCAGLLLVGISHLISKKN